MFLWFELSFDLLTCVNRLDNGIYLSTEITELKARAGKRASPCPLG